MLIIVQSYDNVKIDEIQDILIELIYMIAFFFIIYSFILLSDIEN